MKHFRPAKAMRQKCLECAGGSAKEVRQCLIVDCPLWLYRLGKRPETEIKRGERSLFLDPMAVRQISVDELVASGIAKGPAEKMIPEPSVTYEDVCRLVGTVDESDQIE